MNKQTENAAVRPAAGENLGDSVNGPAVGSIHLIRIPDRGQGERAFQALLTTGESWVNAPDNVMGLTTRQVRALEAAGVVFEWVSKAPPHG